MNQKPWQLSPENALQKSMRGAPVGDGKPYDAIIVVDDRFQKSEPGYATVVYANRGELRQALLDAEQRGDVHVLPSDAALIDGGRIRKALIEALFPEHDFRTADDLRKAAGADAALMPDADGNYPIKKSGTEVVRRAYRAYAASPGADLRAAAKELDDLIAKQNG